MTYFAVRCVAGRELLTKSYIEAAVRNERRTDVINVVVPSQTVLDLNDTTNNRSDSEIMIRYRSYVFVNIEMQTQNYSYEEMPAHLFHFLSKIPNIIQVMKVNVEPAEASWLEEQQSTLVAFGVPASPQIDKTNSSSMLTKVKELIEHKKVLSAFKKFVRSISHPNQNTRLSIEDSNEGFTIYAPIELVMDALDETKLIMRELLNSPIKLLQAINKVYGSYAANHSC